MENKTYIKCSLVENPDIFSGYYENFAISDNILSKLARELGFSIDMYNTLVAIDSSTANQLIISMSRRSNHAEVYFLADSDRNEILGYALDSERVPILNVDFMKRVKSLVETSDAIKIQEQYHASDDTKASIIIKKVEPIVVDQGARKSSYEIGILVMNDELDSAYCRLVVYIDDQPYYLPASQYSTTTNRFKKSTGTSADALEVMILKIIDELREDELKSKLGEFYLKHLVNKEILVTYEEYNNVLRTMMKIPSVIDDRSILGTLTDRLTDFEKKYAHLDDQKSSYIWRCTAMGDVTIGSLVHMSSIILNELGAPAMEYFNIRELIGYYLSTSRIAAEIARADS